MKKEESPFLEKFQPKTFPQSEAVYWHFLNKK
jgi:hypothetical protein